MVVVGGLSGFDVKGAKVFCFQKDIFISLTFHLTRSAVWMFEVPSFRILYFLVSSRCSEPRLHLTCQHKTKQSLGACSVWMFADTLILHCRSAFSLFLSRSCPWSERRESMHTVTWSFFIFKFYLIYYIFSQCSQSMVLRPLAAIGNILTSLWKLSCAIHSFAVCVILWYSSLGRDKENGMSNV